MADTHGASEDLGYETTDAEVGPLRTSALFLVGLCAVSFFAMWAMFNALEYYQSYFDDPVPPLAQTRQHLQGPRLQIDPPRQKIELRALETQRLNSYTWVDSNAQVARIPIDRAKELLANGTFPLAVTP